MPPAPPSGPDGVTADAAAGADASSSGLDVRARFAAIAQTYGPALERLAAGYERVPERRRDLVQEVLVAIWTSLPAFEGRSSLRTWVFRVAHNTAATFSLREQRSRVAAWRSIEDLEATAPLLAPADPEADAGHRRDVDRLAELVRALRPADRQLVLLHLEGLPTAEIAEISGLTPSNVTTRLSRLRAALRAHLDAPGARGGRR